MNLRRKLLATLGAGALTSPLASLAQQPGNPPGRIWRVGMLVLANRTTALDPRFFINGFPRGMRERGYVEGDNLVIDWRFADGDLARLPGLAVELVQSKPDVIVAAGAQAISAVQKATSTIPIVMAVPGDPLAEGFVKSLARPGGNITGASAMVDVGDISSKRLQMLLEIAPRVGRVALLVNPAPRDHVAVLASIQAAGEKSRVAIVPVEVRTSQEIEAAFAIMKREKVGAVIVQPHAIFNLHARRIAELAMEQRLPLVAGLRHYVEAGALMSYGASSADNFRRAAYYVDRIFKGARPADLPVEQPTIFELFINGKTAKTLGLKIPQSLLITAEKVIE